MSAHHHLHGIEFVVSDLARELYLLTYYTTTRDYAHALKSLNYIQLGLAAVERNVQLAADELARTLENK